MKKTFIAALAALTLYASLAVAQVPIFNRPGPNATAPLATALAANPADCAANNFANAIAANGDLTCAQPSASNLSDGTTGTGAVVRATGPTVTSPNVSDGNLQIKGQQLQMFELIIAKTAGGVNQHTIRSPSGGATNFAGKINGATATPTVTPTGADASTAFAGGGKISSAANYFFIFDTADQPAAGDQVCIATNAFSYTGTVTNVKVQFVSGDVNGVTRRRLYLYFTNATTGASINLTTLTNDTEIYVNVLCHLA